MRTRRPRERAGPRSSKKTIFPRATDSCMCHVFYRAVSRRQERKLRRQGCRDLAEGSLAEDYNAYTILVDPLRRTGHVSSEKMNVLRRCSPANCTVYFARDSGVPVEVARVLRTVRDTCRRCLCTLMGLASQRVTLRYHCFGSLLTSPQDHPHESSPEIFEETAVFFRLKKFK